MNKRLQGVVLGVLLWLFIAGSISFASNMNKSINVTYRDIKLVIDDKEVTPCDAAGNVVEPFIHNGTTYLPVRAVGEALGKDIDWDNNTSTVHINDKQLKEVYLYDMDLAEQPDLKYFYKEEIGSNKYVGFRVPFVPQPTNTNIPKTFDDYLIYSLKGKAEKVSGLLVCNSKFKGASFIITIFDDNEKPVLNKSLRANEPPVSFELDVTDWQKLTIKFKCSSSLSSELKNIDDLPICAIENLMITTYDY